MEQMACSKLWTDIEIRFFDKKIGNCCKSVTFAGPTVQQIGELGSAVFLQNTEFLADKKTMTEKNILPKGCVNCSDNWPNSFWHDWNTWRGRDWSSAELSSLPYQNHVQRVDIYLSNACNLSCMYCSPQYSSTWAKLKNQSQDGKDVTGEWTEQAMKAFLDYLDTVGDRWFEIVFIGGEPLLDPRLAGFLEKVAAKRAKFGHTKTAVFIITNLSVPTPFVERYLKVVAANPGIHWVVSPSIENVGAAGMEIRDGINFQLFETNLDHLLRSPVKICFGPTVSSLSLPEHARFLTWAHERTAAHGLTFADTWSLSTNTVTSPIGMHPGILPLRFVKSVDDAIETFQKLYPSGEESTRYVTYLQNLRNMIGTKRSPEVLAQVQEWYREQGRIKNKNYFEIFPLLGEIFSHDV